MAATVTVHRGDAVVARVRSGAHGRFRVNLAPGDHTATAELGPDAPFVACPTESFQVPGGRVDLTCRLLAP